MKDFFKIEPTWDKELTNYLHSDNFLALSSFIFQEYASKEIYPKSEDIFKAFWLTLFSQVKVVIIGQDPYHEPNQAHGLCFSVPVETNTPPSLKNIYREMEADLNIKKNLDQGNLEYLAKQGVLLLNSVLTVVSHQAGSHSKKGWEEFSDEVIKVLSDKKQNIVFILWGKYAQNKKRLINNKKHLVLLSPHPSPLSAYKGFFGCKHFSKTNEYLKRNKSKSIIW